jgi:hypothetical protein
MPNPQDVATPIRMSGAGCRGRLAQGAAQKVVAGIRLNGNEGIQMRAFQVRPQTLLIKSFRSFVVVSGAHDHNLSLERDGIVLTRERTFSRGNSGRLTPEQEAVAQRLVEIMWTMLFVLLS